MFVDRLQRYAAPVSYATGSGELLQQGPFPLVTQVLQLQQPAAGSLGVPCCGLLSCEEGILPQQVFVQRVG